MNFMVPRDFLQIRNPMLFQRRRTHFRHCTRGLPTAQDDLAVLAAKASFGDVWAKDDQALARSGKEAERSTAMALMAAKSTGNVSLNERDAVSEGASIALIARQAHNVAPRSGEVCCE